MMLYLLRVKLLSLNLVYVIESQLLIKMLVKKNSKR